MISEEELKEWEFAFDAMRFNHVMGSEGFYAYCRGLKLIAEVRRLQEENFRIRDVLLKKNRNAGFPRRPR
jgi:hypothetical protein